MNNTSMKKNKLRECPHCHVMITELYFKKHLKRCHKYRNYSKKDEMVK